MGINNSINNNISPDVNSQNQGGYTPLEQQLTQQQLINDLQAQYPGLSVQGILGGLPVAEKTQEYFAVFDEAGDTSPEIINKTQFKVIYLCDSQLNTSKPSIGNVASYNIAQNFEKGKYAIVRADQGTALNPQLVGEHKILGVGSIAPIVGSQIGKGKLQYVTTMSFQLESQLGLPGGINVQNYENRIEKSWGYNNAPISYTGSGNFTTYTVIWPWNQTTLGSDYPPASVEQVQEEVTTAFDIGAVNPDLNTSELGTAPTFRGYFDKITLFPTGSATTSSADQTRPSFFGADLTEGDGLEEYLNQIQVLTSSLDGNTRVRIRGDIGIKIATSSFADIFISNFYGNTIANTAGEGDINNFFSGENGDKFLTTLIWKLYRKRGGTDTLMASKNKTINIFNPSLTPFNGAGGFSIQQWAGGEDQIPGFSWEPRKVTEDGEFYDSLGLANVSWTLIGGTTSYIDVEENDIFYQTITLPEESTNFNFEPFYINSYEAGNNGSGFGFNNGDPSHPEYFKTALDSWKNEAGVRTYEIFGGSMRVLQETRAGNGFTPGVHGVTASYTSSEDEISVYNYTSSYWDGYTNFSSSEYGIGAWLTASLALSNFYGPEYYQINPGTEVYNVYNLEQAPSTSLIIPGSDVKRDWINAGFNPLRLPFVITPGDFIRFEYNPDKEYQIIGVQSVDNTLKLKLDRQLYPSTVLDNFVIYRIIPDGQYLILDVKKDIEAGINQAFTGIIMPEYPSEAVQAKEDELIFELKKAGIIQDGADNRVDII